MTFLKVLRSPLSQPLTLWADAICINQKDIVERGHQVQVMRKIYARAMEVRSWLGPGTPGSALAMDFCNARPWEERERDGWSLLYDAMCAAETWSTPADHTYWETTDQAEALEALEHAPVMLAYLRALCTRRYWKRLWVVPELILGKRVLLYCGDRTGHLDDLCTAMKCTLESIVRNLGLERDWSLPGVPRVELDWPGVASTTLQSTDFIFYRRLVVDFMRLQSLRQDLLRPYAHPFVKLLKDFFTRDCLNLRDRAYML